MDPRPLRALSRELVRELGMLSQQCGSLALSPWRPPAHRAGERSRHQPAACRAPSHRQVQRQPPLARLAERELIAWQPHPSDGRSREASLTEPGKAQLEELHRQMDETMAGPWPSSPRRVRADLGGHAALSQRPLPRPPPAGFVIRPITPADNPRIAAVVRAVSAEYGLTADKGYG